eukprot:gene549-1206_t
MKGSRYRYANATATSACKATNVQNVEEKRKLLKNLLQARTALEETRRSKNSIGEELRKTVTTMEELREQLQLKVTRNRQLEADKASDAEKLADAISSKRLLQVQLNEEKSRMLSFERELFNCRRRVENEENRRLELEHECQSLRLQIEQKCATMDGVSRERDNAVTEIGILKREIQNLNEQFIDNVDPLKRCNRATAANNDANGDVIDDWVIDRNEISLRQDTVLGVGGWGNVKLGRFRGTDVAVKQIHHLILSSHNRRLFSREMNIASRCRHPCLLQFIGATCDDGSPLFVSELLETDLRSCLGSRALTSKEALLIALDVALALNYLHKANPTPIIHRDISSSNVLLWHKRNELHAKLSDYGSANFMRVTMTRHPGAALYSAPETSSRHQTPKVDVFSFGILLCEMLIRQFPVIQERYEQIKLIRKTEHRNVVTQCIQEDPVLLLLRDLIRTASKLVGDGEISQEDSEDAASFILQHFKNTENLSASDTKILKETFGHFPASIATKCWEIVQKIVKILPENAFDLNESKDPDVSAKRYGHKLKLDVNSVKSFLDHDSSDSDTEEFNHTDRFLNQFKQKLSDNQLETPANNLQQKLSSHQEKEEFNYSWLLRQCQLYFPHHESSENMSNAVFDLLSSSRNDAEIQNELFELVGFEAIDLIANLLKHRKELATSEKITGEFFNKRIGKGTEQSKQPVFASQVTIQSKQEKQMQKLIRKAERKQIRQGVLPDTFSEERSHMNEAANVPLLQLQSRESKAAYYPYVFDALAARKQSSAYVGGAKILLPADIEKENTAICEEVFIPPTKSKPPTETDNFINISELDEIGRWIFKGFKKLNRIQSVVFDAAYNTNENLLVAAPTGAGKTNIALLTIAHEIKNNIKEGVLKKDEFKIVYVAPMKALAAEMTASFGKRLEPLGISVKELTGDMQLTKTEILKTQMLITTPEKWDVVTRKSTGDVGLSNIVKLLIIDEVHLLHDERGSVIETLVARTLRQVETTQSMIRIIGLSATLPNYLDVARFLHVNPMAGLFFFDGRFRPVPLGQSFIGVKGNNYIQTQQRMDEVCYEKVIENVEKGNQVMVFVHARNATVRTALQLRETARNRGDITAFLPEQSASYGGYLKQVMGSRNKQLRELFPDGFSTHHAGMLRRDRNLVENLFAKGFIKVLVCTATLAWGVNLPAHAVIIKGTEIYDAKKGSFVDIGILDVMQIFGRAGRPQFDKEGLGYIITKHDKLPHYLSLLTRQTPIESQFVQSLTDNLNAEISLGTVTNVEEAVQWLSYTYLYVRMHVNSLAYGITYKDKEEDPLLYQHRTDLIKVKAKLLDKAKMIRFDERTGYMFSTDLGRIASHFYIKYDTVEVFNEMFKTHCNEADVFAIVSHSQEFQQVKVREDEIPELQQHLEGCVLGPVKGGVENEYGKVNILLQTYVSRAMVDSFSLVSDMSYIAQNAARIVRALFEISLKKGWPAMTYKLLKLSKVVDKQIWDFEHPLRQCEGLTFEILQKLEAKRLNIERLRDMEAKEIGLMIHHVKMGHRIKSFASQFPALLLASSIQPITRTVLRVRLDIVADFIWNDKLHSMHHEPWWIWVEDPENDHIYHSEYFLLLKNQVRSKEAQCLVFTIPIFEPLPSQYLIRVVSDRWLGAEAVCAVSFKHLILPEKHPPHTELLDLHPLPVTALKDPQLEMLYKFTHFNPVQTQIFHTLYYTDHNVLLGAPTGSGKTVAAELAMFRTFREHPGSKAIYIAPLKALVKERIEDWKTRFVKKLGKKVIELTGDVTPDTRAIASADVIVTTPEKWDGVSRSWQTRNYVKNVSLLIIDEIHLLGDDRGPVLEVIVSRTNFISSHVSKSMRIVGLSTALANARDLADWLGIENVGLFNFRPSVRPVPLQVHIAGFPGKHYCPRMATMNKPAFKAIQTHSPEKPVLIFVSSRRQTRLTALDLIAYLAGENNPKQWLHMAEDEMMHLVSCVRDQNLKLTLSFGIGLHHAGLHEKDREIAEELFVNQKIQVLVATSTLAWGVNFPAHLVVVKGTEYFDGKACRYVDFPITDVLQMIGRAGRPQFDDQGVAVIFVHDEKKHFYKKFLYEPFPVESNLVDVLPDHLNAEIVAGTITSKQDALDYLTWTYLFRRLLMNPTYYGIRDTEQQSINEYLSNLIQNATCELARSFCIELALDDRSIEPTTLGRIASYYYLAHETLRMFKLRLSSSSSFEDLLKVLSDAEEYSQLPVRHNEDQMNRDLAAKLPIPTDDYKYDDAHTKAHLLFQAHFSRVPLPIADYATDTKSVQDQAIRILQAMIDVCADQGWLATSLRIIMIIQMVNQGRWHHDCPLLILPHVDDDTLPYFKITGRQRRVFQVDNIPELIGICENGGRGSLHKMLNQIMSEQQIDQIFQLVCRLPQLSVRLSVNGIWANENSNKRQSKGVQIDDDNRSSRSSQNWMKVHADQEYVLQINANRIQIDQARHDLKAYTPKFPKLKEEGWIFVLGEVDTGDLLALKRVGVVKRHQKVSLSFFTPDHVGRHIFTLFIMSDCYLGLDQQYDIYLDVMEADISAQINTDDIIID